METSQRTRLECDQEIINWYVIFYPNAREHWWDWFTHRSWRHCAMYGWNNGSWIVFDVADKRSRLRVLTSGEFAEWHFEQITSMNATAIVKIRTQLDGGLRARIGLWCVTGVKHMLGLRSSALRPKALFRDLISNDAEVIHWNGNEGRRPV